MSRLEVCDHQNWHNQVSKRTWAPGWGDPWRNASGRRRSRKHSPPSTIRECLSQTVCYCLHYAQETWRLGGWPGRPQSKSSHSQNLCRVKAKAHHTALGGAPSGSSGRGWGWTTAPILTRVGAPGIVIITWEAWSLTANCSGPNHEETQDERYVN